MKIKDDGILVPSVGDRPFNDAFRALGNAMMLPGQLGGQ